MKQLNKNDLNKVSGGQYESCPYELDSVGAQKRFNPCESYHWMVLVKEGSVTQCCDGEACIPVGVNNASFCDTKGAGMTLVAISPSSGIAGSGPGPNSCLCY